MISAGRWRARVGLHVVVLIVLAAACCAAAARAADAPPPRRKQVQQQHVRLSMREQLELWLGGGGGRQHVRAGTISRVSERGGGGVVGRAASGGRQRAGARDALRGVGRQGDAEAGGAVGVGGRGCSMVLDGAPERKVLQVNGSADDVAHVLMCPQQGSPSLASMRLVESSSRDDVLSVGIASASDVHMDVVVSEQTGCQNLTLSFAFEKMVGMTNYTVAAREGLSEVPGEPQDESDNLCSVTLSILVAGISVYTVEQVETGADAENALSVEGLETEESNPYGGRVIEAIANSPGTHKVLYTGNGGSFNVSYEYALQQPLFTARAFIQFPDGSDSFSTSTANLHEKLLGVFLTQHHDNSTIPISYNGVACIPVELARSADDRNSSIFDSEECGVAFRETSDPVSSKEDGRNIDKLQFRLRLSPYRIGTSKFTLTWDGFASQDLAFEDEEYTNVFDVTVTGAPLPVVLTIRDPGPMFRSGGEEIEVEMANTEGSVKREFIIGGVVFSEVPGSYRQNGDGVQFATFLSEPGNGTTLAWLLRVTYPDGDVKVSHMITSQNARTLQYKDDLLKLENVQPSSGKAGDIVKLSGYFDGFDTVNMSDFSHGVFFNNVSLPLNASLLSINADTTVIELQIPNRSQVGPFFEFDVKVLIDGQFTNSVVFTFLPDLDVEPRIVVLGSSFNKSTQRYEIGSCGPSRFALSLPQGIPHPNEIRWSLYSANDEEKKEFDRIDMLQSHSENITSYDKDLLVLPSGAFQNQSGIFQTEVVVSVLGIEATATVLIEKLDFPNIGVTIFQPPPRSINVPNTPLRISSFIDVPDSEICANVSPKVIYEWAVGNETQRFSFANFTESSMENSSMPSRLGREYVVPATKLAYGPLKISLYVYMEEDPEINGYSEVLAQIEPPPLLAMIGNGEAQVTAGIFSDLVVSGEQSFDPDSVTPESSDSAIDTHMWSCAYSSSLQQDDTDAQSQFSPCVPALLPDPNASRLTISKEELVSIRDAISADRSTEGGFRIRYSLQVGKDFRLSSLVTQTILVRPDPFEVATLSGIAITDNEGNTVDWTSVRYYEGLILLPTGEGNTWKFSVLSPASERNTLLSGGGIINRPGYYAPGSQEASQDFPLGLNPYALSPGTTYLIEISVYDSRPGVEQGSSVVSITTLPKPQLMFPPLSIVSGDEKTLFSATASVNLDTTYAFLYYYYLINEKGEEFCVDGCSGASYVQFYVELPGTYMLRCELVDSLGKSTLHEITSNSTIIVSGSPTSLLSSRFSRSSSVGNRSGDVVRYSDTENAYGNRLQNLHWSGDHGNLELLVSTMSAELSQSEVLASSEGDFAALECAVTTMHQVMVNSAPSTRASQSYVRTASRLSSINSVYFATEQVMYTILSMVDNAITKVPETEALEIEKDLQMFYNRSIRHVLAAFTGFTSRVRLQQYGSGSGLDARSLVIDTFRLQGVHLTRSVTRGAECGMTKSLSTVVDGGIDASAVESQMNGAQIARSRVVQSRSGTTGKFADESLQSQYSQAGIEVATHSTLTISVLCNREQGTSLRGDRSTLEWCDSVFDSVPGLRAQSVQTKMDPKSRLVFSMMETIDFVWLSGLGLDKDPTDTQFLVTTNVTALNERNEVITIPSIRKNCFTLNTTVTRLGITANRGCLSVAPFRVQSLQMPFEPKVLMKDFQRSEEGLSARVSRDNSSTVLLEVDSSGIFGARGTACPQMIEPAPYEHPSDTKDLMAYTLAGIGGVVAVATGLSWVSLNALFSRVAPV